MPDINPHPENSPLATAPALAIVRIPSNPTGDTWIDLFQAMCLLYCEPPIDGDLEGLARQVNEKKSACLAEYGLHLNV